MPQTKEAKEAAKANNMKRQVDVMNAVALALQTIKEHHKCTEDEIIINTLNLMSGVVATDPNFEVADKQRRFALLNAHFAHCFHLNLANASPPPTGSTIN